MKRHHIPSPSKPEGGSSEGHQRLKIPYVLLEDVLIPGSQHKTYVYNVNPEKDTEPANSDNTIRFICSKCEKSFRSKIRLDSHICPLENSDPVSKKSDNVHPNFGKRKSSVTDIQAKVAKTDSDEVSAASTIKIFQCQECSEEFSSKISLNGHMASHRTKTKPKSLATNEQKEGEIKEESLTMEDHTLAAEDESTESIVTAEGDNTADYQTFNQISARESEGGPSLIEVVDECIGNGDGVMAISAERERKENEEQCSVPAYPPALDTDENPDMVSGVQTHENKSPKKKSLKNVISKLSECEFCDEVFGQKSMLESHVEAIHAGKKFCCEHCGIEFKRKSNLSRHISRTHREPAFKCNQCPKAFPSKYDLERHLKIHSVKENLSELIQCIDCDKGFVYKKDLKIHRRQTHKVIPRITDEPPVVIPDFVIREHGQAVSVFRCSLCPRSFSLKTDLQRHFLIHSGAKPFACEICNSRFNRKSNLIRHKRIMHQVTKKRSMHLKMKSGEIVPWEEEIIREDEQWVKEEEEMREWEDEMQDPRDDEEDEIHWEQETDDAGDGNENESIEFTFCKPDEKITVSILTFE